MTDKNKSKSRAFSLTKVPLVENWINTQQTPSLSLNHGIIIAISEFGMTDLPTTLAQLSGEIVKDNQLNSNIPDNLEDNKTGTKSKKLQSFKRTFSAPVEGPINNWLDVQKNASLSVNQLIIMLATEYGVQDLPIALAKRRGELNRAAINRLTDVKDASPETKDVSETNSENGENHNSSEFDLSILHDRDLFK